MSKVRYFLAAVVGAALLSACVPVPTGPPPPPTPDQIAQVDLIKGLNAEQSVYASISQYDATVAAMKGIDPSLDWGDKLTVWVGDAQIPGDGRLVCLDEMSTSGTTFSIARIATGANAGTYYGKLACPSAPSPAGVMYLGTSW